MSISKKLRFDVFKRDSFTCVYCGKTPPLVILEVDHLNPKSKGGTDVVDNLVTACFDCNRGKGAKELKDIPSTLNEKTILAKEKRNQLMAYNKMLRAEEEYLQLLCDGVNEIYTSYFPEWQLTDNFMNISLKMFIKKLPITEVEQAMRIAWSKIKNDTKAIKYFCGICHNMIRDKNE